MSGQQQGRVKAVTSGDTLIIQTPSGEKQLSLAHVSAPRLSANEPWGWESRERLRQLVIGKPLTFRVAYEAGGREYADFTAPIFPSLVEYAIAEGWARARPGAPPPVEAAEMAAQKSQKGLWSTTISPIKLHITSSLPKELCGSGRQVPSVVERVLAGDRMVLRAMMDSDDHFLGPVLLAGVRVPPAASTVAREFVASRLLCRNVRAIFHALGAGDQPLVTLVHPQGDIALVLAESGLAEVEPSHASSIGSDRILQLRQACQKARESSAGIWRERRARRDALGSAQEVVVERVVSSDLVELRGGKTVQLSSVRAPRKSDPEQEPFVPAAREFARRKLIGRAVQMTVDGRPENSQRPDLVTLAIDGHNVGLEFVRAGWASAVRHRRDDADRSPFAEELLAAEQEARDARRGMWGKPPASAAKIVDASENVVRARGFLSSLERRGRLPGVVEHVFGGGRLRIQIPSENCSFVAVLDGLRVPRPTEPPAGPAAAAYTLRNFGQRDVAVSVRQVDKTGAFVSQVWLAKGAAAATTEAGEHHGPSMSLNAQLVAEGLASVHEPSATVAGTLEPLVKLQEQAREAKKGLWVDWTPQDELSAMDISGVSASSNGGGASSDTKEAAATVKTGYQDAVVTHVASSELYYRLSADNAKFAKLSKDLASFFGAAATATTTAKLDRKPRRGELVGVKSGDNWLRARVTAFDKSGTYELEAVDVGSVLTVSLSGLRSLPPSASHTAVSPLVRSAALRFVHSPPRGYVSPFIARIEEEIGSDGSVVVSLTSDGRATVFTADSKAVTDSLNSRLISGGYASVPEADSRDPDAQSMLDLQREAQEEHIGMWEYGDPRDDDDL